MYGATMGTLNVYVGQTKVFTKSGNQGNQWKQATLSITQPGASEVKINIEPVDNSCSNIMGNASRQS